MFSFRSFQCVQYTGEVACLIDIVYVTIVWGCLWAFVSCQRQWVFIPIFFQCAQYIGEIARYLYATPECPEEKTWVFAEEKTLIWFRFINFCCRHKVFVAKTQIWFRFIHFCRRHKVFVAKTQIWFRFINFCCRHKVRMMFGNGLRPQIWQKFVDRWNNVIFNSSWDDLVVLDDIATAYLNKWKKLFKKKIFWYFGRVLKCAAPASYLAKLCWQQWEISLETPPCTFPNNFSEQPWWCCWWVIDDFDWPLVVSELCYSSRTL